MTRVKSISIYSKALEVSPYRTTINLSAKTGRFTAKLPDSVAKALQVTHAESDTLEGIEKRVRDLMRDFEQAETITRKVIVCKVEATLTVFRPDEKTGEKSWVFQRSDISFQDGAALAFACGIYNEISTKKGSGSDRLRRYEPAYSFDDDPISSAFRVSHGASSMIDPEECTVMDWTQEREDFFAATCRSFEELTLRLFAFFGDKTKMIESIDSGMRLLDERKGEE